MYLFMSVVSCRHSVVLLPRLIVSMPQPDQETRLDMSVSTLNVYDGSLYLPNIVTDFGFLDGISNPAVAGFSTTVLPGQTVVPSGTILTGRLGDVALRPSWTLDGTFMAFRKLQQKVPEFDAWTLENAIQNPEGTLTVQQGADYLGARMFGRWKSGAPTDITPLVDDPTLGADPQSNNNFDFAHAASSLISDQSRCPFSAHIRKTNPRADLADANTINHAIRAGTPYGPEVSSSEASSNTSTQDRGMAFGKSGRLYSSLLLY